MEHLKDKLQNGQTGLPSRTSIAQHIKAMRSTPGWIILVRFWNEKRDALIKEGKKSRAAEKGAKMWAVLEGFDQAVLLAEEIEKSSEQLEQNVYAEDEE